MPNIFDYIDWRDIEIEKVEFNEVDNLILSRLSYFPLDKLIAPGEKITIRTAYERYKISGDLGRILQKEDKDFFPKLAQSKRFGKIHIGQFVNKLNTAQEKQFCAVTIFLPDDTIYVAYRGTDNTIIGWKEDFNMSFQELVPSQIDAANYLNKIATIYPNDIRIGGHSKGGNLAIYASAFSNENIKERIIKIYNNDGPGFHQKTINSVEYKSILNKLYTYLPQSSIIGRLLNNEGKLIILKSTQTGIMQHDLYTWQVLGDKFVKDEFTQSSEFIDSTITNWLKEVSPEQRGKFIDTLFEILNASGAKTLSEMGEKWFFTARTILKTYMHIDEESKKILLKTLGTFFNIAKNNIKTKKPKALQVK